ncbi:hypothetical protein BDQ17DRAFT_1439911 [Cyathus striatus]|nr:hypothetical protein BDQ17DRAFT_1439911 [Cyathus striatus]
MASLAVTYSEIGKWEQAEKLEIKVLNKKRLLGKWEQAEKLQKNSEIGLELLVKIILNCSKMAYLAASYSNLGKWEKAEKLQNKS